MLFGWLNLILGLWMLSSPWILGYWEVTLVLWNQITTGVLLLLISLWQFVGSEDNLPQ